MREIEGREREGDKLKGEKERREIQGRERGGEKLK